MYYLHKHIDMYLRFSTFKLLITFSAIPVETSVYSDFKSVRDASNFIGFFEAARLFCVCIFRFWPSLCDRKKVYFLFPKESYLFLSCRLSKMHHLQFRMRCDYVKSTFI